ncbi:MAG: hypothetical protein ACH346_02680 [Chthoniobacterales bacterium]
MKNKSVVVFNVMKKVIESAENGPSDLSANPNYFHNFGQDILSASPKNSNHHSF